MLGADAALSVRFDPLNRLLQSPIDCRGFVGVIFPLMRSKDFLHHPVYISSRCSEYNRGSSVPSHFFVLVSFCSFLPLSMFAPTKNRAMPLCCHITTLPCRPIRHTLAYRRNDTIRRVGGYLKESGLCYWYSVIIPTLHPPAQTTT